MIGKGLDVKVSGFPLTAFRINVSDFGYSGKEKLEFINDLLLGRIAREDLLNKVAFPQDLETGSLSCSEKSKLDEQRAFKSCAIQPHTAEYNFQGVFVGTITSHNQIKRASSPNGSGVYVIPILACNSSPVDLNKNQKQVNAEVMDSLYEQLEKEDAAVLESELHCTKHGTTLRLPSNNSNNEEQKNCSNANADMGSNNLDQNKSYNCLKPGLKQVSPKKHANLRNAYTATEKRKSGRRERRKTQSIQPGIVKRLREKFLSDDSMASENKTTFDTNKVQLQKSQTYTTAEKKKNNQNTHANNIGNISCNVQNPDFGIMDKKELGRSQSTYDVYFPSAGKTCISDQLNDVKKTTIKTTTQPLIGLNEKRSASQQKKQSNKTFNSLAPSTGSLLAYKFFFDESSYESTRYPEANKEYRHHQETTSATPESDQSYTRNSDYYYSTYQETSDWNDSDSESFHSYGCACTRKMCCCGCMRCCCSVCGSCNSSISTPRLKPCSRLQHFKGKTFQKILPHQTKLKPKTTKSRLNQITEGAIRTKKMNTTTNAARRSVKFKKPEQVKRTRSKSSRRKCAECAQTRTGHSSIDDDLDFEDDESNRLSTQSPSSDSFVREEKFIKRTATKPLTAKPVRNKKKSSKEIPFFNFDQLKKEEVNFRNLRRKKDVQGGLLRTSDLSLDSASDTPQQREYQRRINDLTQCPPPIKPRTSLTINNASDEDSDLSPYPSGMSRYLVKKGHFNSGAKYGKKFYQRTTGPSQIAKFHNKSSEFDNCRVSPSVLMESKKQIDNEKIHSRGRNRSKIPITKKNFITPEYNCDAASSEQNETEKSFNTKLHNKGIAVKLKPMNKLQENSKTFNLANRNKCLPRENANANDLKFQFNNLKIHDHRQQLAMKQDTSLNVSKIKTCKPFKSIPTSDAVKWAKKYPHRLSRREWEFDDNLEPR